MTPDQLRELADRVSYAATFLMRPGTPSIYWNACNRAADYLRLQAHTHPAPAAPQAEPLDDDEISKLAWQQNLWTDGMIEFSFLSFARAVEQAHGIGGSDE